MAKAAIACYTKCLFSWLLVYQSGNVAIQPDNKLLSYQVNSFAIQQFNRLNV
jgi:hypothetical protein